MTKDDRYTLKVQVFREGTDNKLMADQSHYGMSYTDLLDVEKVFIEKFLLGLNSLGYEKAADLNG